MIENSLEDIVEIWISGESRKFITFSSMLRVGYHPQHLVTAEASFLFPISRGSSNREKKKGHGLLLPNNHGLPRKQKCAQEGPDEDTNDNVPIEVHRQQHDEIRHRELQHMQDRTDRVFDESWTD